MFSVVWVIIVLIPFSLFYFLTKPALKGSVYSSKSPCCRSVWSILAASDFLAIVSSAPLIHATFSKKGCTQFMSQMRVKTRISVQQANNLKWMDGHKEKTLTQEETQENTRITTTACPSLIWSTNIM